MSLFTGNESPPKGGTQLRQKPALTQRFSKCGPGEHQDHIHLRDRLKYKNPRSRPHRLFIYVKFINLRFKKTPAPSRSRPPVILGIKA